MKITLKDALKYSITKWKYVVKTGCTGRELRRYLYDKFEHVYKLKSQCGLCQYTFEQYGTDNHGSFNCELCLLGIIEPCCSSVNEIGERDFSTYEEFDQSLSVDDPDQIKERKRLARIILKNIKSIKQEIT